MVPREGLEPSWACAHGFLKPARLPFRHLGVSDFLPPHLEINIVVAGKEVVCSTVASLLSPISSYKKRIPISIEIRWLP